MIAATLSVAKHAGTLACLCAGLILSAPAALAVPGPLDDAHHTLDRALNDHLRKARYQDRDVSYVRSQVRYSGLRNFEPFKAYRRSLIRYNGSKIKTAPVADRKAFWINSYNALVIDGVLEEYPLESAGEVSGPTVQSVPDFFTKPRPLAGEDLSLRQIENRLREFRDPRVWFALNQAAAGSPRLPEKAYNPTDLEEQLDAAVANYLADVLVFRTNPAKNEIVLSELFQTRTDEFSEDPAPLPAGLGAYPSHHRKILGFLLPRLRPDQRDFILQKHPTVVFEPFDWTLNEAK